MSDVQGKIEAERNAAREAALIELLYCACGHPRGYHFVDGHGCLACPCRGK